MGMQGKHHSEKTKRILADMARRPIDGDRLILKGAGQIGVVTFAEKAGCSEQTARNRLERLRREGYAERFRIRGTTGYLYAVTVKASDIQVLTG